MALGFMMLLVFEAVMTGSIQSLVFGVVGGVPPRMWVGRAALVGKVGCDAVFSSNKGF